METMQGGAGSLFPIMTRRTLSLCIGCIHYIMYTHTRTLPSLSLLSFCGIKELNIEQHKKNQLKKKFTSIENCSEQGMKEMTMTGKLELQQSPNIKEWRG